MCDDVDIISFPSIPHKKLPSYPELMIRDKVEDPENYEFVRYEYIYEDGKVSVYTGDPVPRIKSLVYINKNTRDELVINL